MRKRMRLLLDEFLLDEFLFDEIEVERRNESFESWVSSGTADSQATDHLKAALATLMFEAYQGTVDDDGETLEDALAEVEGTFNGRYGRWFADGSFILRSSEGSGIIAASLLTLYQGLPLLAFSMTHPRYQRRGHARSLITASIAALQDRGFTELHLAVHRSNEAAIGLYRSIGFCEIDGGDE